MNYVLKKRDLGKFIDFLKKSHRVIAPVKRDIIRYDELEPGEEIVFESPLYPAKKFFYPVEEDILKYKDNKIDYSVDKQKQVIFMNKIDAFAVKITDQIYLEGNIDPYYKARRDNTVIIEIPTKKPKNNFHQSMDYEDNFDLRFVDNKANYLVEVGSQKGKNLITSLFKANHFHSKTNEIKPDIKITKKQLNKFVETGGKDSMWKKLAEKCLSCGACTIACPTCTCFRVEDDIEIGAKEGRRYRKWTSCQVVDFTRVAGGFVFRDDRVKRIKQRINHKFKYHKELFGHNMCVGCGRCITACPAEIDITEPIRK